MAEKMSQACIYSVLHLVKKNGIVCEIGVRNGESSEAMLERGCFVYMIDPFIDYPDYPQIGDNHRIHKERLLEILKKYPGKYKLIEKMSDDAVNDIPDELDFVYIDGNHEYEYVKRDIYNYWPKIKEGGYMAGDDWTTDGVKKAVESLLGIEYHGRNWLMKKFT